MPIVPATGAQAESTWRSVTWGLFLCVIFTVASAYSGLKVGQVMEAAIPISILAIGLARAYKRRSTLLENVILTGIGGTSGAVVAGAIFTLPALYTLGLNPHPAQTIFICLAGGCLGVLFLIPLRRYFVRETHGEFPFPEATAITEVLVTGERGGSQAKLLLQATGLAGVYDFFVTTFQVWREFVDLQFVPAVKALADQARMVLAFDAVAFILGLGYVMGLRSSAVLVAGGLLSNLVLVPHHLDDWPAHARRRVPGHGSDRRHDRRADLPGLCALHRRRRHCHRRHLRHHQVAAHRRRLVRDCRARVPPRRDERRADGSRHPGDGAAGRRGDRVSGRRGVLRHAAAERGSASRSP